MRYVALAVVSSDEFWLFDYLSDHEHSLFCNAINDQLSGKVATHFHVLTPLLKWTFR